MHQAVIRDQRVQCPTCASPRFTPLRREVSFEHVLVIQCRCDACNQVFGFREDRCGRRFC